MKDYLELSGPSGPLFLLGVEVEATRLVAWAYTTDVEAPAKTIYQLDGVSYESEQPISTGVCLYSLEESALFTILSKPLILRRVSYA
jgi:hypothetical protein